jgi:hypothetical protein
MPSKESPEIGFAKGPRGIKITKNAEKSSTIINSSQNRLEADHEVNNLKTRSANARSSLVMHRKP